MNQVKHWICYSLLIAAVVAGAVSWQRAHDAWKDFQHQAQLQSQVASDEKRIAAEKDKQTAALQAIAAKPATVQSVTRLLPVPLPGQLQVQPADTTHPAQLVVAGDPQANLEAIQQGEIKCAQCRIDLTAANALLADEQKKTKSLQQQVT